MSLFNLEALNASNFNATFETRAPAWPIGEYICRVDKAEFDVWTSNKDGVQREGLKLNVTLKTDDPEVCEAVGTPPGLEAQFIWGIMIDTTETGAIATGPGKNIKLGQFLEAIDLNGKPWSPAGLAGHVLRVAIKHRLNKDTGEPVTDVKRVSHI